MDFAYQSIQPENFNQGRTSFTNNPFINGLEGPFSARPMLTSLPPERVGLNGEYDYEGLAKRVLLALQQTLKAEDIQELRVAQRGRVVILKGTVFDPGILEQAAEIAAKQEGAIDVETVRVKIERRTV